MKLMRSVHPGRHLATELSDRGLSATALADALSVNAGRISDLIEGRTDLSPDLALRLGRWMGVEPEYWMRLDSHHRLVQAAKAAGADLDAITPAVDAA